MSKSSSKLKVEALKAYLEEQKQTRKKKTTSSIVDKVKYSKYTDVNDKYKFRSN